MKKYIAILSTIILAGLFLVSCDKVADLPNYGNGTTPVLTASATTIAPQPIDSNKVALVLNWTNPNYATDTAKYKYTIEIDSTGKNFSNASRLVVNGNRYDSIVAKDLNKILVDRGYAFNVPVDMDVRLISSYANNNERLTSNTLKIRMTPYKVPPKVPLPTTNRLFIVGDATTFGWSNDASPAFPAARELARLNETTWAGVFYMNGTGGYKLLTTQGNWDLQYHRVDGTANEGTFEYKNADPTFPSPTPAGWYILVFDFQTGKYSVTPAPGPLPQELYATGDAVPSNWTNTPPASQKFTRLNSSVYELTVPLETGKAYKFLSSSGNWQPQFGGKSATGGALGANYGSGGDPDAIPAPAVSGNYKITVNFATNTYTVVKV